jgi:hypothetical protein
VAEEPKDLLAPSEAQTQVAFSGPAPGVNRFVANLGQTGLRVAFIEDSIDGTPHFRGAVTMHPQDGIKLYKMLQGMLAELEIMFEKMEHGNNG